MTMADTETGDSGAVAPISQDLSSSSANVESSAPEESLSEAESKESEGNESSLATPSGSTSSEAPPEPEWWDSGSFDWDEWDGSHDSWPEQLRPWGERMSGRLGEERTRLDSLRDMYQNMIDGEGGYDPTLPNKFEEASTRVEKLEAELAEAMEVAKSHETEFTKYKGTVEKAFEREAEEYARRFQDAHSDVFDDADKVGQFEELLDGGWSPEDAVEAVQMPPNSFDTVIQAVKSGAPFAIAKRLAEAEADQSVHQPRPAAKLTSGAARKASPHQTTTIEQRRPKSFDDIRNYAVERAFAVNKRRK